MNIIYFLAPLALLLGFGFAAGFIFAVARGQFDDTDTPAHRILLDDEAIDSVSTPKGSAREHQD
ncbi:MAG: cbb3-type cytochrome oxidase assembly protein CcoS [Proteobacteria bacterium]|nr:MAG: cbb3-type cytochrome oxidase assembly protein CcoS [Pseudomonadota bacterium]